MVSFSWQTFFNTEVFVFNGLPALDQKAMRIVVKPFLEITDIAFRNQAAGDDRAGACDLLNTVVGEMNGIALQVQYNAVAGYLLAYVAGDKAGVIPFLPELVILILGGAVCQVGGFLHAFLDGLFIWDQVKEVFVKGDDLVFYFDAIVVFAGPFHTNEGFAVGNNDHPLVGPVELLKAGKYYIAIQGGSTEKEHDGKQPDVLKGGVYIFKMLYHTSLISCFTVNAILGYKVFCRGISRRVYP